MLEEAQARIYIAARVREAKQVEELLTRHGIDYDVQVEPYINRLFGILPVEYKGAVFLVPMAHGDFCRNLLRGAGLTKGLIDEE